MIKFQLDIKNFLDKRKPEPTITNNALVKEYYRTRGITDETTTKEWLIKLAKCELPSWTRCYYYIREQRKNKIKDTK